MKFRLINLPVLALALLPGLIFAQTPPAPASVPAPAAVPALTLPAPPAASLSPLVMPSVGTGAGDALGSTQLRESAKVKAQTDLENLRASLEAAQHNRLLAQKKFTEDLNKDTEKKNAPDASGPGTTALAPLAPVEPKPYATSYYDFNGKSFARVIFGGAQFVVSPGTPLPDGAKVKSVSPTRVVIVQDGKRITVPYLGGGLGSGQ